MLPRLARKDMRPGQMFGLMDPWWPFDRDVLVVVDATTEVSFWSGILHRWGDVGPSLRFEVLS